ncbi:MAG TPA: hypothetical protein VFA02_11365 [Pseudacidobacterium sp.]|nr:hypothetical protein [Pseudacidobacterium sp.]
MAAPAQSNESMLANDLAHQVITNEIKMQDQDHSHGMYQEETVKNGVKEINYTVQTPQGELSRLIAKNGQLLNEQERQAEDQRIEKYLNDPSAQRKKQQSSQEDARKTRQLFQMLPDALTFSYAERNGDTVKLNFEPNPSFHPPSREAKVFHELEGQMIVNVKQKRLMEIHGHLKDEVHFGILGHLNKGGTFDVRQEEVAPGLWEITLLKVNMQGKALFFKTISVQQNEMRSHYRRVPDNLTLQQAKDMLDKQAGKPLTP